MTALEETNHWSSAMISFCCMWANLLHCLRGSHLLLAKEDLQMVIESVDMSVWCICIMDLYHVSVWCICVMYHVSVSHICVRYLCVMYRISVSCICVMYICHVYVPCICVMYLYHVSMSFLFLLQNVANRLQKEVKNYMTQVKGSITSLSFNCSEFWFS